MLPETMHMFWHFGVRCLFAIIKLLCVRLVMPCFFFLLCAFNSNPSSSRCESVLHC